MTMRKTLAFRPRSAAALVMITSCTFAVTACGIDDGKDGSAASASSPASGDRWNDATMSYPVPERWDADSVATVLESSMIGAGVDGGPGVVADGALFVGAELNSVKRSADGEAVNILKAMPLKDTSVEQQDYRLEMFTRDSTEYVALWRKGVPESNDERRLGDENSSDTRVFLSVWDAEGTPVFDGPLDGATEPGGVVAGLAIAPGDYRDSGNSVFDPLTGLPVDDETAGYDTTGHSVSNFSTKLGADDIRITRGGFYDHDYGNDAWRARDLVDAGERDSVTYRGIIGDYAFFEGDGRGNGFAGSSARENSFIVSIPHGEISHRSEDTCTQPILNNGPTGADNVPARSLISPDGTKVVQKEYMFDATADVFTCDEIRGGFEPLVVLDDGTVYGYGEQGSGDSATRVAASMKIGDEEALKEDGCLPFHVDVEGRGWFADSVSTDQGTENVVFVLNPSK